MIEAGGMVLRTLRTCPWFGGRLLVPHAGDVFDASGQLVDEGLRRQLRAFVHGFIEFIASVPKVE